MAMALFFHKWFRKGREAEAASAVLPESRAVLPVLAPLAGARSALRPLVVGTAAPQGRVVAGAAPFQAVSPFAVVAGPEGGAGGRAAAEPRVGGEALPSGPGADGTGAGGMVELRLRAVLRDADAARLGFAPGNVPESVMVSLAVDRLAGQVALGRVEVGIDEIRRGVAAKFRPAFARAAEDLRVVIPLSEVFPQLPESARPGLAPVAAPVRGGFATPFAAAGEEPENGGVAALPALLPRSGLLSRAPGSGLSSAGPRPGAVLRSFPKPAGSAAGVSSLSAGSDGEAAGRLEGRLASLLSGGGRIGGGSGAAALAGGDDLGASFSAAALQAEPPPRPGSTRFATAERTVQGPEGGGAVEDLSFGWVSDLSQVVLRAVLGTDEELRVQDIVDRCAGLEGISACVLLRPDGAVTSQGLADAAAFQASAVKTRDSLEALAEPLGLGAGGNFTLRSDLGVRSFFMEPGLCLGVWHERPAFSGGTREKLILIARELARL